MDYAQLGLKCGIEIHQQLDTSKLFCECPSVLREAAPDLTVKRKMHAVAGELGIVDPAAMQAALRGADYAYQFYRDSNCLVELDEEPPHEINKEALETAVLFSKMLGANVVGEIQVMRKTVLDGSNTSGFQRTCLIATGGKLNYGKSSIGIQSICLEEDASRIIKANDKEILYNLDRLGVPLIEIATTPDIKTPEQAREVALSLGLLLRATKKVKRGIGTIRQDLNISIKDGARVEIKGVQELNILPKAIENEVKRQFSLIVLKSELLSKNVPRVENYFYDLADIFRNTEAKIIKNSLSNGKSVLGIKLPKFAGLLNKEVSPNRRFGTELADYARSMAASGLFHSDELPNYGITADEVAKVCEKLRLSSEDAFIIITDAKETCEKALTAVVNRINLAFEKLPVETRKANQDGTSSYLRPLPGGARMYPETDLMPIDTRQATSDKRQAKLPKPPWDLIKEIEHKFKLSNELATELYDSEKTELFEKMAKSIAIEPTIIANTLTNVLNNLNLEIELGEKHFADLFIALKAGKFSKEAIQQILGFWATNPNENIESVISKLGFEKISRAELEKIIRNIVLKNKKLIEERGESAISGLMGDVMKEVRGRADGKLVMKLLRNIVSRNAR